MSIPFYGDIDLNNNKILNIASPINDNDIIPKLYLENAILASEQNTNILITSKYNESTAYTDSQILAVNNRIDALDGDIQTTIDTAIGNSCVNSASSTATDKPLAASIGNLLNTNIQSIDDDVQTITSRVTTNENNITSLDTKVTTNSSNISDLDSRITTCETDISILKPNIYSKTQTEIGTYKDKTLYRQVLTLSDQTINTGNPKNIIFNVSNNLPDDIDIKKINIKYVTQLVDYFNNNVPTDMIDILDISSVCIEPVMYDKSNKYIYLVARAYNADGASLTTNGDIEITIEYIINQE